MKMPKKKIRNGSEGGHVTPAYGWYTRWATTTHHSRLAMPLGFLTVITKTSNWDCGQPILAGNQSLNQISQSTVFIWEKLLASEFNSLHLDMQ